ncbi:MAG: ATP-binding protein [Bacteriovoracaceae bacterium]|jgi:adenylate kinase family enzyme|nr:ATP-binding protein [Bacteriovoracaceae bacterium]
MKKLSFLLIFMLGMTSSYADDFENKIAAYKAGINSESVSIIFDDLNSQWRALVDKTPDYISKVEVFGELQSSSIVVNDDINRHFEKLLIIGQVRNEYLEKNVVFNKYIASFSYETILDLKREFQLIPMRFFAEFLIKVVYVKESILKGFDGIKQLVFDLLGLLVFFIVPIFMWIVLRKSKKILEQKLVELRKNRYQSMLSFRKFKITDITHSYILNIGLFVTFRWLRSNNESLAFIFSLFEIYFLYRIVITLSFYTFGFILDSAVKRSDLLAHENKKRRYAKRFGKLFLIYSLLFHIVEFIGGGGISFYFIKLTIQLNVLFIMFAFSSFWKTEVQCFLARRNNDVVAKRLNIFLNHKLSILIALPALIYVLMCRVLTLIIDWLERFDFIKQISAKIFKNKLKSDEAVSENENVSIPKDYEELFIAQNIAPITIKNAPYIDITNNIDSWLQNPLEENSLAISGQSGSGKTVLINRLLEKYKIDNSVNVIYHKFIKRISSKGEIVTELLRILGLEGNSVSSILASDTIMKKTIVILDECHHLFISSLGGFEAYKKLLEIINLRLENIFWVSSFNQNSWNFLNAIYGKNEGYRFSYTLSGWSEEDIKRNILTIHEKSNYTISYRRILRAINQNYDSEGIEEASELFFRLLWEQSGGNPKIAIHLWLSSLSFRGSIIEVGLPKNDEITDLHKFSDNMLFVYAAIIKHENLTVKEAIKVTHLSEGIVRHAMKMGLENEFLARNEGAEYSFFTRYQYRILNYLKKKNFIIGN